MNIRILILCVAMLMTYLVGKSQPNVTNFPKINSISIICDSTDIEILEKIGYSQRRIDKLTIEDYPKVAENLLQYFENHGYPFAEISLDNMTFDNDDVTYRLHIDKNRFVTIDSLILKGNAKINHSFLWPYLSLRRKSAYNEKSIQKVGKKLSELPYVTEIQASGVSFEGNKTFLYLYLDKKNTNLFDGYVGFQPVSSATNKLAVTGNVMLSLQNLFHIGEKFELSWHSSEKHSQYLNIRFDFPYLFYSRFGVKADFELDKHDTSYLTLNFSLGIPYRFVNDCYIRPFFSLSQSQILNNQINTSESISDFTKSNYGLQINYQKTDYAINPRKGILVDFSGSAGKKSLKSNAQNFENANNEIKSISYAIVASAECYIPVYKYFTFRLRSQFGGIFNTNIVSNELFNIGGNNYIRGFANNELQASTYLTYSAEFRYLFGKNSDIHVFFDGGSYESRTVANYSKDSPFGFGIGLNLGVKSGIFYLEYALPHQHQNRISFKTGKIHFGVKAVF